MTVVTRGLEIPIELRDAYDVCRQLTRRHGTTYYWATRLLPADRRPHVYALYGLCRHADDIVDSLEPLGSEARENALVELGMQLHAGLAHRSSADRPMHRVVRAAVHTARTFAIDVSCFDRFFASMAMDLRVKTYESWSDLCSYMDGSAAVIGEMLLPILEPLSDDARLPAQNLGLAFQLTNFLRDVGEDLDRERIYLPQEDMARFGAHPRARRVDDGWRSLMRFEIARARDLYASAEKGIALLPPWSAPSIAVAHELYGGILDVIEANDYDVFTRRARVSTAHKLMVAARTLMRARRQ